ncbi:MAG TPA: DUF4625 domain-containing protein [Flavobacterium sp.]|nr:DUF4625 domain-containing protein [Flavobacterium sp.]
MKKLALLSLSIIGSLFIVSCSDDDNTVDTTKPTIEIVSPTDHQEVEPGSSFFFKANLSDDSGLASYKIEVHYAEDGHEHKKTFAEEFVFNVSVEVPGQVKTFSAEETIDVPETAKEGHYHIGITVLDTFGNQNQQFTEIYIGHDSDHDH